MFVLKFPIATILTLTLILGLTQSPAITPPAPDRIGELTVLGTATLPTGFQFAETEVGGLSGITYNAGRDLFYAVSDSRGDNGPARFYTLKLHWNSEPLKLDSIEVVGVTFLVDAEGQSFPVGSLDPEGIAFAENHLWISSEGNVERSHPPFVKQFSLQGREVAELPMPNKFFAGDRNIGIRNNLALESLTLTPDQNTLFTATENALIQDGPEADENRGSPSRILRYNLAAAEPEGEFFYETESVVASSIISGGFRINGLVDLLALSDTRLLALERSFALGTGNTIRLFEVSLAAATDIASVDSLKNHIGDVSPASKTLLLSFNTLGLAVDNVEGLTFGPILPDGRRSLIFVADNNFNPLQQTQVIAFAIAAPLSSRPNAFSQGVSAFIKKILSGGVDNPEK